MTLPDISTLLFGVFNDHSNNFTITTDDQDVTTIKLTDDIILDGNVDISNSYIQLPENGTFDGSNHCIDLSNTTECMGIIKCSSTSRTSIPVIKNLGIKNGNLKQGSTTVSGNAYLLRRMPKLYADIINCYSMGPISDYGGGFVPDGRDGRQHITLTNCYNTGTINGIYAGGLCGKSTGYNHGSITLTNCYNVGNIIGEEAGGLCGNSTGYNHSSVTLTNCYNRGTIIGGEAGGLCGSKTAYNHGIVKLINCYNTGDVNGDEAGGLCGSKTAYNHGIVKLINCYNTGDVNGDEAGGLCGKSTGYNHGSVALTNCYNTGIVTGSNSKSIIGSISTIHVKHIDMNYVYTSVDTSQNGTINNMSYSTLDISEIYNKELDDKFTEDTTFIRDIFDPLKEYPILGVFRTFPFSPPMDHYKAETLLNQ